MKENITTVSHIEFTKISPEVSESSTRLKRWKENIIFLFSQCHDVLFGFRQSPALNGNLRDLKPLTVSVVKRPVIQRKNLSE